MHKIQIGTDIVREYPSEIGEMTPAQFVYFSGLVFLYQTKKISFSDFSRKLSYKLCNIKRRVNINDHPENDIILGNISKLMKLNDNFFTTQEDENTNGNSRTKKNVKIIKLDFVKNLIPKITTNLGDLYGPSTALFNTEFGEYVSALNAYFDFSKTGDESDLNWLVASLYRRKCKIRKKNFLEDTRVPFDKDKIQFYANELKKTRFPIKYAVYLWFSACQSFIITTKELEISGGVFVDLSVLFNKGESNDKGIGMKGVIYSLAETNVFGDAEKTEKQNTYDIFLRMLQTYLTAKKMMKNVEN